jgi:hypothetical protein
MLGMRASVEQLNNMGMIDKADPDQRYKVYQLFGQSALSPALDIHMQAALRKQDAFERWAQDDAAIGVWAQGMQQAFGEYQSQVEAVQPPAQAMPKTDPTTGVQTEEPVDEAAMAASMPQPPSLTQGSPLAWKVWYSAQVHRQEFLKWANGDSMVELLAQRPELEDLMSAHMLEIDMALQAERALMAGPQPAPPQKTGGGEAMKNSNQESGGTQTAAGK